MASLILDTSILVAIERTPGPLNDLIDDQDDVAIAAVTAAELLVGVELASTKHKSARRSFVDGLLMRLPVEVYDLNVAREHAALLAWTRRSGQARGAHDLIIAATAKAAGRVVVTADAGGFQGLPGIAFRSA